LCSKITVELQGWHAKLRVADTARATEAQRAGQLESQLAEERARAEADLSGVEARARRSAALQAQLDQAELDKKMLQGRLASAKEDRQALRETVGDLKAKLSIADSRRGDGLRAARENLERAVLAGDK
jgi:chromosome segregation ATPase